MEPPGSARRVARRRPGTDLAAGPGRGRRQRLHGRDDRAARDRLCPPRAPASDPEHRGGGWFRRRHRARADLRPRPGVAARRRHRADPVGRREAGGRLVDVPAVGGGETGRAGQPGRVDRRARPSDEHTSDEAWRLGGGACGCGGGRLRADPVGLLRLADVRRAGGPRAWPARGRLLLVERRLRVLHEADPRARRPLGPGQRRGAQDQDVRLDRRRPGGAVLPGGPQQGLAVHPQRRADPGREGALCRLDATTVGPDVRALDRPPDAGTGAAPGAPHRPDHPAAAERGRPGRGRLVTARSRPRAEP